MSAIRNIVVAGASGNLGPAVIQELLSAEKFNVFVLTRPTSSASFPASVNVVKTDYSPGSLDTIFKEGRYDAVVSTLNNPRPGLAEVETALIDAAKANGVKRFIPSEFASDTTDERVLEAIPLFGGKISATKYLRTVQSEAFTWTALITGAFFDLGLRANVLNVNLKDKKLERWDGGNVAHTVTNRATIGKAIANLLGDDARLAATVNKFIYISSYTITNNQLIETLQKVTGETWPVEEKDSEVERRKALADLAAGNHYAAYDLRKAAIFGKAALGHHKDLSDDFLGLPKESFEADLKAALEATSK